MRSSAVTSATFARNSAICCCRWFTTLGLPRKKAHSPSPMWFRRCLTRCCAATPHVFGTEQGGPLTDPEDVNWQELKAQERAEKGEVRDSILDGVPQTLSGLTRAHTLTKRAAKVGFDWTDPQDVLSKITEETSELVVEIGNDQDKTEGGVRRPDVRHGQPRKAPES